MIYKVKKYLSPLVDRRQLLNQSYMNTHALGSLDQYERQDFWPLLKKQLDMGGQYLDAGCGVGGWILFLREQGYNVAGLDEAPRVLRAMTEYNPDISVKQGALTAMPYANASFDGVLAIGSLDHVEHNLTGALGEMNRVLKPGGLLFIEMPLLNTLRKYKYVPLKRVEAFVRRLFGGSEVFAGYLIDQNSLKQLLTEQGFTVEAIQPHDLPEKNSHYGLYTDWPWYRGNKPYELNVLGRVVKILANSISPWLISTGVVVVARKR